MTENTQHSWGTKALVTGGGGFLGKAIVKRLLAKGFTVRSFSRKAYPELKALGVEQISGEISDPGAVLSACRDCDIVFHVAARPGIWGDYQEYYRINFVGTENVIGACRKLKIPRLVYTSSPSVVFDGRDCEGLDESMPYPAHYETAYPETKALAEKAVLAANSPEFMTVSLRPHLIWGPEDNHLVPRIVQRAKAGVLRFVGDGKNRVDTIYIDNAADAHMCAAEHLQPGAPCLGKPYFITQNDPRTIADFLNGVLKAAGLPPETRTVPATLAYAAGWAMETFYSWTGKQDEPRMTRFLARELSTHHWFNVQAATRDLGFTPTISIDEGFQRLTDWFAGKGAS
jgi:nucleoside-diphosphate-sugar epimerase